MTNIKKIALVLLGSFAFSTVYTEAQKVEIGNKALEAIAKEIFVEAMKAKKLYKEKAREELLYNYATTAPMQDFQANMDVDPSLNESISGAFVFASSDNQQTWSQGSGSLIGTEGFENTWGASISLGSGTSSYSYLRGIVASEALGYNYGDLFVTGSPINTSGAWPPSSNLYADLADVIAGDVSSSQDIYNLKGSYKLDASGNTERIYMSMGISGGCCEEGGLFGPWYLYGVGIVNPESVEDIAYAIGYGNGGFGQLYPGVLKISGDLATGNVENFEYISTSLNYNTSGDNMQATCLLSTITNDSDWGTWPNSYNGFIALGVTVEAGLNGLDVAANVLDQTNPGLFIQATTVQEGNVLPVLSDASYNEAENTLSVFYSDSDGNLPWERQVSVCYDDVCELLSMIPGGHDYLNGVTYTVSLDGFGAQSYEAFFDFKDSSSGGSYLTFNFDIGGGSGCGDSGDINGDSTLNVLDVVLLTNLVLGGAGGDPCADVNGDGVLNVLDIVLTVNLILNGG